MARFNEILVGRYNRFVQKIFSMKGPASLATVSDELMTVLSFFHGAENRYLEGWDLFGMSLLTGISAANFAAIQLRNPVGSNVIGVISQINIWNSPQNTDTPIVANATVSTDLSSVSSVLTRLDARGRSKSTLVLSSQATTPANQGIGIWQGVILGTVQNIEVIQDVNQEIPILPGDAILIRANTVNQAIGAAILWRERFLEDSERT